MNKRAVYEANKVVLPMVAIFGATVLIGVVCAVIGDWLGVPPSVVFVWGVITVGIPSVLGTVWVLIYRRTVEHDQMYTDTWR